MRKYIDGRPKYVVEEQEKPLFSKMRKLGAVLLLAATSFLAGRAVGNNEEHPTTPVNTGDKTGQEATHVYTVRPGDTLWGIARDELGPNADVRDYVDDLSKQLKNDGVLRSGDKLVLKGPADPGNDLAEYNPSEP